MGQVVLGFRSLLVKASIFVVMAALLAWAVGGTLWWSRPETANLPPVQFAGKFWNWRLTVGGFTGQPIRWQLFVQQANSKASKVEDAKPYSNRAWESVSHMLTVNDSLYFGGQMPGIATPGWLLIQIDEDGQEYQHPLPDRLAIERQLARLENGLPLQDTQTILEERHQVLSPPAVIPETAPIEGNNAEH